MTNLSFVELENVVLKGRLASIKKAARELLALIEMEGEDLTEAIENLKDELI